MHRTSLRAVTRKALRSRPFFNHLVRNPEAALEKAGIQLSSRDLKSLKAVLMDRRVTMEIDIVDLFRAAHRYRGTRFLAAWDGGWPIVPATKKKRRKK